MYVSHKKNFQERQGLLLSRFRLHGTRSHGKLKRRHLDISYKLLTFNNSAGSSRFWAGQVHRGPQCLHHAADHGGKQFDPIPL